MCMETLATTTSNLISNTCAYTCLRLKPLFLAGAHDVQGRLCAENSSTVLVLNTSHAIDQRSC
jgi:hypothetical protein